MSDERGRSMLGCCVFHCCGSHKFMNLRELVMLRVIQTEVHRSPSSVCAEQSFGLLNKSEAK